MKQKVLVYRLILIIKKIIIIILINAHEIVIRRWSIFEPNVLSITSHPFTLHMRVRYWSDAHYSVMRLKVILWWMSDRKFMHPEKDRHNKDNKHIQIHGNLGHTFLHQVFHHPLVVAQDYPLPSSFRRFFHYNNYGKGFSLGVGF